MWMKLKKEKEKTDDREETSRKYSLANCDWRIKRTF